MGGKGLDVGVKPFWLYLLACDSGQDLDFAKPFLLCKNDAHICHNGRRHVLTDAGPCPAQLLENDPMLF